jgi:hypothetical protein
MVSIVTNLNFVVNVYLIADAANICPSEPIVKTTMEAITTNKSTNEIYFVMITGIKYCRNGYLRVGEIFPNYTL